MSGLSTMVSISFGIALVAGRTRVPRPATGKTALRIFMGALEGLERAGKRFNDTYVAGLQPGTKADVWCDEKAAGGTAFVKLLETGTGPVGTGQFGRTGRGNEAAEDIDDCTSGRVGAGRHAAVSGCSQCPVLGRRRLQLPQ